MDVNLNALSWLDLQLFAGEKTEEATPKKLEEARKKGQVARSTEINSVVALLAVFIGLKVFGPYINQEAKLFMRTWLLNLSMQDMTSAFAYELFLRCALVFAKLMFPVMLIALLAGLISNYLQVGFLFSTEALNVNFGALNPITGFQRIFSKKALADLIKSLIKIGIVGYVVYNYILDQMAVFPNLMRIDNVQILPSIGSMTFGLIMKVGMVLGVMAVLDLIYQRWQYGQNLKMSKQEIKDEYKQIEGDPKIKAKIKERQRMMAMRRMMQEVPKADVIITNPTHFAIALKYDLKAMAAPVLVAKGQDLIAKRIKEIAKEHNVSIVENKPLAQTLFKSTEVGEAIPTELYQAVAEILAYVYRLKRKI